MLNITSLPKKGVKIVHIRELTWLNSTVVSMATLVTAIYTPTIFGSVLPFHMTPSNLLCRGGGNESKILGTRGGIHISSLEHCRKIKFCMFIRIEF